MDWDDLRYLLALARHHTFQQAAVQLGVNYTTVSRKLSALQDDAGVRLIEKTGRAYTLTEAGLKAVKIAEQMEDRALELERGWFGRDARLGGSLRLTTSDILGTLYVDAIAAFTTRHPEVDLEVNVTHRKLNLTKREADVSLRMTTSPPEHLVGRRLARFEYGLYGAQQLVEQFPDDTPLEHFPWLAWGPKVGARVTEQWMAKNVPNARITAHVDAPFVMLALARAGVGVTFMFNAIGDAMPELKRLRSAPENFTTEAWLLTHAELRGSARVRALMTDLAAAKPQWPTIISAE